MSLHIVISQLARLASVWTRNRIAQQVLISISIGAYTALLLQRNAKIEKYYDRSNSNTEPKYRDPENRKIS